jgi:hypothetical protein
MWKSGLINIVNKEGSERESSKAEAVLKSRLFSLWANSALNLELTHKPSSLLEILSQHVAKKTSSLPSSMGFVPQRLFSPL